MSVRNLRQLFAPKSVALVGATERPGSVGATVLRNLREGGFKGQVYPVNPKYDSIAGLRAWPDVASLPRRRTWPSSARRHPPCPASSRRSASSAPARPS
jgi:predicted CoA-binding protein